uniref:Uncharacterized protein n=1 Tax=Romanomermis culicivorax TaxID=13658 RepID=A0A915KKT9_ROMCU
MVESSGSKYIYGCLHIKIISLLIAFFQTGLFSVELCEYLFGRYKTYDDFGSNYSYSNFTISSDKREYYSVSSWRIFCGCTWNLLMPDSSINKLTLASLIWDGLSLILIFFVFIGVFYVTPKFFLPKLLYDALSSIAVMCTYFGVIVKTKSPPDLLVSGFLCLFVNLLFYYFTFLCFRYLNEKSRIFSVDLATNNDNTMVEVSTVVYDDPPPAYSGLEMIQQTIREPRQNQVQDDALPTYEQVKF